MFTKYHRMDKMKSIKIIVGFTLALLEKCYKKVTSMTHKYMIQVKRLSIVFSQRSNITSLWFYFK